jgi:hypothetical protein
MRHWLRWNDSGGRFHAICITAGSAHLGELVSVLVSSCAGHIEIDAEDSLASPRKDGQDA